MKNLNRLRDGEYFRLEGQVIQIQQFSVVNDDGSNSHPCRVIFYADGQIVDGVREYAEIGYKEGVIHGGATHYVNPDNINFSRGVAALIEKYYAK